MSHPLSELDDVELEFITQFVLRSGSLKEMAEFYHVSYPTIRSRLDEIILRLKDATSRRQRDPMSTLISQLVETGQMMPAAGREIRNLYRMLMQIQEDKNG